jgi:4-amino-4-deoxy-L-arabinose transferase-like glycosyltransferase
MVAVLVLVAAVRLRLLNFSLERDEGEYAYAGQLMLQGIPPYELAYNMKFPGTYLAYAAIMGVFGQSPAGIHFGLLLLTTATALMLFWLGGKILDETAGVVAATSYAMLAASPAMLGIASHATHFCAFFATAGLCLLWRVRQKENGWLLAAGGVLFGTAVLMKQHAAVIAVWAGLSFAFGKLFCAKDALAKRLASIAVYGFAMLAPLGLCCLWLWLAGVFASFKFWTIDYAREYASGVPLAYAPQLFWHGFSRVISFGGALWLLGFAGLFFVWRDARWKNSRAWFLGFCAASALAVCPDFYFRKHYFLIALPALALLAGAAVGGLRIFRSDQSTAASRADWPAWGYALVVAMTLLTGAGVWFVLPFSQIIRGTSPADHGLYGTDPLPEAEIVAEFIHDHSAPDARVAILGSEPEIYFLARRHSATGYIYTYALMEPQPFALKMQLQMIGDIETNRPEFIVFADNLMSWNKRPDSDPTLFHWWDHYKTNYTLVGLTDIVSPTNTIVVLGTNFVAHYPEARGSALEIFQRQ